jgi:peptidoglycan/LPS O-acetylase OafA/YrhL
MEIFARESLKSPVLTLIVMCIALGTSLLLLWLVPPIHRAVIQTQASTRFRGIDGLRGYLALGVFASHIPITWMYLTRGKWTFLSDSHFYMLLGETCVTLFFMMTGFLFWNKVLESAGRLEWRSFLLGRVFRIYPLFLLALGMMVGICFALQNWQAQESFFTTLRQCARWLTFSMVDINHVPQTAMFIAYVAWSLRYEWLFYAVLPLAAFVFVVSKRSGYGLAFGGTVMAVVIVFDPSQRFLAGHCISFLGGIIAAYSLRTQSIVGALQHPVMSICAVLAIGYVLLFAPSALHPLSFVLLTIFFTIIASGNMLWNILQPASVIWLGEISYSIYLLHGLVLWFGGQYCYTLLSPEQPQAIVFIPLIFAVSCAIVILASLTHLLIEKPGILLGKRIIDALR